MVSFGPVGTTERIDMGRNSNGIRKYNNGTELNNVHMKHKSSIKNEQETPTILSYNTPTTPKSAIHAPLVF